MNELWQIRPGLFRKKTCESWIEKALEIEPVQGTVGHGGDAAVMDDKIRRSQLRWINRRKPFVDVWDRMIELFHEANSAAFGFNLWRLPSVQFTEYSADRGDFYGWHEDITWVRPNDFAHRKLSMVVQLSDGDSYKGGDFELKGKDANKEQLRMQGSVIVFPSFLSHRVTPVIEGVRYSLVAWMEGPKFR